ncbi:MAG: hypothetical protein K9M13_02055 [Simkaniaceae bacterium]|nr:hypothetical protein [Simkaniaceae bacterium]
MPKYEVEVEFTATIFIDVEASNQREAKHLAEQEALKMQTGEVFEQSLFYLDRAVFANEIE